MRLLKRLIALLLILLTTCISLAQEEATTLPYYQLSAFNVPILPGWEDQSTDTVAQFHLARVQATIRTAMAPLSDPLAASESDLRNVLGSDIGQTIYQGKVNLADGTWTVLVYQVDDNTTASVMARAENSQSVVISFIERDPSVRAAMLTIAQSGESSADPSAEIALALEALTDASLPDLEYAGRLPEPNPEWEVYIGENVSVAGMVFGNDSYVALIEGPNVTLPILVMSFNSMLMGFFITPDNSGYLALALAAVFVILGGLIFSFYWRWRNLRQDVAMIARLQAGR